MNSIFDQYGNLNIDDLIAEQPSFLKIMEDGKVTEEELKTQTQRVTDLLKAIESTSTPEQIDQIRQLLAEISVLIAARNIYVEQSADMPTPQIYHCNDCGNTIYRHEVFCTKCGKKLDRYDFED